MRGIVVYCVIVFGLAWAAWLWLYFSGDLQANPAAPLIVAATMWAPGIAAFVVRRWRGDGFAYVAVIAIWSASYLLTLPLGWGRLDLSLGGVYELAERLGIPAEAVGDPAEVVLTVAINSLTWAPLINTVFGFGEEFGWRGYLLPRLLPLGTWSALLWSGVIWGVWHAPIVAMGHNYPGYPIIGPLAMVVWAVLLSVFLGWLRLASGSIIAPSFGHGLVNAGPPGFWAFIILDVDPLRGGITGLTGMLALLVLDAILYLTSDVLKPRRRAAAGGERG